MAARLTKAQLADMATCFSLQGPDSRMSGIQRVNIELREGIQGKKRWAVKWNGNVLNKNLNWEYEMNPSNRTDTFIKATRFKNIQYAYDAWCRFLKKIGVKQFTNMDLDKANR